MSIEISSILEIERLLLTFDNYTFIHNFEEEQPFSEILIDESKIGEIHYRKSSPCIYFCMRKKKRAMEIYERLLYPKEITYQEGLGAVLSVKI